MRAIIDLRVAVPFFSYKDKKKDKKALLQVKRYIREKIKEECNFVPLYIEKDINGREIEDCSSQSSVKLTKAMLKKK